MKTVTVVQKPTDIALPEIYEKALALIEQTIQIDDSKEWVDRTEALVSWARMYQNDKVSVAAKRLRLHAFRRMGTIAGDMQRNEPVSGGGRKPGPLALLQTYGLTRASAAAARYLSKRTDKEFEEIVGSPTPPAPTTIDRVRHGRSTLGALRAQQRSPFSLSTFVREVDPAELALRLTPRERTDAIAQLKSVQEWIRDFAAACAVPTKGES